MQRHKIRRHFQETYGTVAVLGVVVYCAYNLFGGDHGLRAQARLQDELQLAQVKLLSVEKEKTDLEKKVQGLHPKSLDPDLLEQRVRELLGYSSANEVIFIHPPQP